METINMKSFWLRTLCLALCLPMAAGVADSATAASSTGTVTHNKAIVLAFNDLVFNKHQAKAAYARYAAPDFHHHAQWSAAAMAGTTHEAIVAHNVESFEQLAQRFPKSHREVKQAVAQGDLVVLHSLALDGPGVGQQIVNPKKGNEKGPQTGEEVVDIYRLANGRIVEHWEISQPTTSLDDVF